MMKFKEEKYRKLYQRKSEIYLPRNVKISLLLYFWCNKYNFINNFIVRFMCEDDVAGS